MGYIKNIGKSLLYMILIILVLTFLVTLLNYFNIIGTKFLSIMKILIILISTFVGGFLIGKESEKKGWLEGIKLGIIFTIVLALFNYLGLGKDFTVINLIYYLILIISCTLGSMIGINKKSE